MTHEGLRRLIKNISCLENEERYEESTPEIVMNYLKGKPIEDIAKKPKNYPLQLEKKIYYFFENLKMKSFQQAKGIMAFNPKSRLGKGEFIDTLFNYLFKYSFYSKQYLHLVVNEIKQENLTSEFLEKRYLQKQINPKEDKLILTTTAENPDFYNFIIEHLL